MTLLHTSDLVPAVDQPEFTAAKRLRAFGKNPSLFGREKPTRLDVPALQAKYHQGAALEQTGTFRVPLGTRWDSYERARNEAIKAFLDVLDRQGWTWTGDRIQVYAGMYPAHDLDGMPDLGSREFLVVTRFRYRGRPIRVGVVDGWRLVEGGAR